MKQLFASLLIISFLSIAVFGFAAMHRGTEHGHHGCIAVIVNGLFCLKEGNPLAYVIFHLNTFKSFSTAVFTNNLNAALLALLTLVFFAAMAPLLFLSLFIQTSLLRYLRKIFESRAPLSSRKFIHWFSLHENSPSLSFFRTL